MAMHVSTSKLGGSSKTSHRKQKLALFVSAVDPRTTITRHTKIRNLLAFDILSEPVPARNTDPLRIGVLAHAPH